MQMLELQFKIEGQLVAKFYLLLFLFILISLDIYNMYFPSQYHLNGSRSECAHGKLYTLGM